MNLKDKLEAAKYTREGCIRQSNADGLKRCPFCGGIGKVVKLTNAYVVICDSCSSSSKCEITFEKAVENWNRRAK